MIGHEATHLPATESYMGVSVGHAAHKFVVVLKYGVAAGHEFAGILVVVVLPELEVVVVMPELEVVVVPAARVVVPATCVVVTGCTSHFFDVGFAYGNDVDVHVDTHAFVSEL